MIFKRRQSDMQSESVSTADRSPVRTVVLVGHCFPDRFMLKSAVNRAAPGAPIKAVNDDASLAKVLDPSHVLLVNRVLEGRFETGSGIDLIRRIAAEAYGPVAMLISNFDDAQRDAEAAGAHPGVGKGNLYESESLERIRAAALVVA